METDDDQALGGAELASEAIPSEHALLMASLVLLEEGYGVEIGLCSIEADGIAAPRMPVVFLARDARDVRIMAERAVQQLPAAQYDSEGAALLAQDGDIIATAIRAPSGEFLTIGWDDGSAVAHLPVGDAAALPRVLLAAERQLAELGLVSLDPGQMN